MFSLLDFTLVKLVYLLFGLWALKIYPVLGQLDWWFWLVLGSLAGIPLLLHWSQGEGNAMEKSRAFIASNTPSLQVLLFLSQFFIGILLGILLPGLLGGPWWLLLVLIGLGAIKPMTKTVLW
jgi:hypothetical protein